MAPNDLSEDLDPTPNLQFGPLAALVMSLLAGVGLGLATLAFSFSSIPTDTARLGVLAHALNEETTTPSVVVFGNSALMSGFDARVFTDSSPGQPLAWNCASTGQSLTEAALLTQELPNSVKRVVYALQIRATPPSELIHPNKFNTLFMSGVRPTEETRIMLEALGDSALNEQLSSSWLKQIAASRWVVRQLIDGMSRRLLRPDLKLEKAATDLFHPQAYSKPIKAKITNSFIAGRNRKFAENDARLSAETSQLSRALSEIGKARGRETIFLFPPSHPGILEPNRQEMNRVIADFQKEFSGTKGVTIISAIDLLPQSDFIDDMHPTDAGAVTLTRFLARNMATTGEAN